ncbi:hypothetical protein [Demequina sp. NBRC 110053]|uniref:hypothetical protein n=1 Tax=Demequina sp. NBRC 110053 TaxID=1570342 RepID=UPI00190F0064|nr:hypothetical protein [Demequina sp. NBRC 110053]
MFVLTADQRDSTGTGERVDELVEALAPWSARWSTAIALPLERTVGDEVQVLLTEADAAVDLALRLMREGDWSVGLGAGDVQLPLRSTSRASFGPVFLHARDAVERARGRTEPVPLVVAGADAAAAGEATALLQLLGAVVRRRSEAGWQVADALVTGASRRATAEALGISPQAVSQRASVAMLDEEKAARPLAARLLTAAQGGRPAQHAPSLAVPTQPAPARSVYEGNRLS